MLYDGIEDNGTGPCPNCGSKNTGAAEYGSACHNTDCPIVMFNDE